MYDPKQTNEELKKAINKIPQFKAQEQYKKISNLIQKNRGETEEEKRDIDARIYNDRKGANTIELASPYTRKTNGMADIKYASKESIKKIDRARIDGDKSSKIRSLITSVAIVAAIATSTAVAYNLASSQLDESPHAQEVSYGEIAQDENGYTTFSTPWELEEYCAENNIDIENIKFAQDSTGQTYVANTGLNKTWKNETSKGPTL